MSNQRRNNSAFIAYLRWTASCRWTSRRTFDLAPSHVRKRQSTLNNLQEVGSLSCKKMAGGRRFKLTEEGYEFLVRSNPSRYQEQAAYMVAANEYDTEKVRRISLLGEAMVMMEQAGYAVHPDDKPGVWMLSSVLRKGGVSPAVIADRNTQAPMVEETGYPSHSNKKSNFQVTDRFSDQGGVSPAVSAKQTEQRLPGNQPLPPEQPLPTQILSPLPGISEENEFRRIEYYYYFTEEERKRKNLYLDTALHQKRPTPIGCYYTVKELRGMLLNETIANGGAIGDLDAIVRYTKISGLLFTSGGSYRVYSTEQTAPVIRRNGERNMGAVIESWCGNVYRRSLERMYGDKARNYVRGTVLFGDKSYRAALSVIRESFRVLYDPAGIAIRRKKESGADTANFNVRDMGDIIYLPVLREALPLLSIMIYPDWERWVRKIGMDVSRQQAHMRPPAYEGIYDATLDDNSRFACLISLDLRRMMQILQDLDETSPVVHLYVMEWQRPFFTRLTTLLDGTQVAKLDVEYGSGSLLTSAARKLQKHFGHNGIW